ncbi:MAG: CCA tRNA nucleotidyltransferase [SAR202 cluster bacterium]|nr:CCA tRNA nucleotidyltransferase [SAR202 cluster bacterium]
MSNPARPTLPLYEALALLPEHTREISRLLHGMGAEAYIVGGAVRDLLMGRRPHDLDIAVRGDSRALAEAIAARFGGHAILMDRERGIVRVTVHLGDQVHTVDINPYVQSIDADLARRDFAINAMAVRLSGDGAYSELLDPYGGVRDLAAGLVRAVQPGIFAADPARLMRAPRLAAQLGFAIESATDAAIISHAPLISTIAPERVRDELLKLLAAPGAKDSVILLDRLQLLGVIIPEIYEGRGVTQPAEHYWDVFTHNVETVGQVERVVTAPAGSAPDLAFVPRFDGIAEHFGSEISDGHTRLTLLKLAGLLHDVAKPDTRTVEPGGRIRFLGHHLAGAEITVRILGRLRVGHKGVAHVRDMVESHLRPSQMAQPGNLPTPRATYRYYRDIGDAAIDTLYLNMGDYLAARGPTLKTDDWRRHCTVISHILKDASPRTSVEKWPTLVDGRDIIGTFAIQPGPEVGRLLEIVREAQATGEITTREDALTLIKSSLRSGGNGA